MLKSILIFVIIVIYGTRDYIGHLNRNGLRLMNLSISNEVCEPCMKGKLTRLPFRSQKIPRNRRINELMYTDIVGPISPVTKEGYTCLQTITDDPSHFVKVYLSEAEENLRNYTKEVDTQKRTKVRRTRCDNGGELSSNSFKQYCKREGISIECTQAYSPQQNGVSKRLNRTLYNKARTMMVETGLPKYL